MRRVVSGLGAMGLSIICGCSQDPGQGSQVGQSMAGGGGNGEELEKSPHLNPCEPPGDGVDLGAREARRGAL